MRRLWDNLVVLFRQRASDLESRFQKEALETILPFTALVFFLVASVVMPLRFGLTADLFFQPNFLALVALLVLSSLAYLLSRHNFKNLAPLILPCAFLAASLALLRSPTIIESTPFVPFYAAIAGIVMAGTFLSVRQMTLYLVAFVVLFFSTALTTTLQGPELMHRTTILFLTAPFTFTITVFRQKNLQDLERQSRNVMDTANMQSMAQLSGTIAHEINNPLAIISGHAHKLIVKQQRKTLTDDELSEGLAKISETVFRISRIISGLRKISREDQHLIHETVAISALISDALALLEESLRSRKIQVHTKLPSREVLIECYPVQITQIFINLVTNAMDALDNYDEVDDRWIELTVSTSHDWVSFHFTNSGPALAEDLRSKIFTPFFTTKAIGKGTGLGLSLCQQIALAHKGEIYIAPNTKFTTFVLSLPKTQAQTAA